MIILTPCQHVSAAARYFYGIFGKKPFSGGKATAWPNEYINGMCRTCKER